DRQLTFGKRCRSGVRSENPFKSRSILSPQDALLSLAQFLDIQVGRTEEMDVRTTYSLRSDKSEVVVTNCSFADAGIVPVSEAYIQTEEGTLEPVYDFQVKTVGIVDWFNVQVHAETGKVMRLINYSSHATYNVYPMGATNPLVDKRKLVKETPYAPASPFGWHSQGLNKNFTNTIGNNVYAGDNRKNDSDWEHNPKPSGKVEKDGELVFDFPIDLKQDPSTYVPASTTNVFYWVNKVHDIFYHFGFDEKAGNFQQNNFGRGGEENDAVTAFVEDADDPRLNDAYFTAPPDGEHGILRMQVFTAPHPSRDSSLDISVITHECTHGLNVRLVGGSHNTGCLSGGEANGMNEGWADFFAILLHLNANHNYKSNFEMGVYINYPDTGRGIRNYPYSTSTTTNPETYKSLDNNTYWDSHPKGAVWANMLLEVYQNLLLRLPFTQDWYTKDKTSYANTLIAQLVIDGLKLTSCEPSFLVARDAILQAEKILTGGKYQCDIWKGFSKRGLGPYAQVAGYELETGGRRAACFELPDSCKSHYL
ncbi:Fungalysin metallopeptidase-domain-containing protein, partial [Mortierella sp. GBAus27b]